MNEHIRENEEPLNETKGTDNIQGDTAQKNEVTVDMLSKVTLKIPKKKNAIIAVVAILVIAMMVMFLVPSEFERVRKECLQIAGSITGSGDYFMIDTYLDGSENLDETMKALLLPTQEKNAIKAIKYANEKLGFNGSLYSKMLETNALMGRQSEENGKYKVSWTYHPDDGLEVTYEKK